MGVQVSGVQVGAGATLAGGQDKIAGSIKWIKGKKLKKLIARGSVRDICRSIPRCCLCGRACPGGTAIGGSGNWGFSQRQEAAVGRSRGRNSEYAPGIPNPRFVGLGFVVRMRWIFYTSLAYLKKNKPVVKPLTRI